MNFRKSIRGNGGGASKPTSKSSPMSLSPISLKPPINVAADLLNSSSSRSRTVSTPAQAKSVDGHSIRNQSQSAIDDAARARRASATTTFSVPRSIMSISSPLGLFTRRRRSTQPPHQNGDAVGDVIEIGPTSSAPSRKEEVNSDVNDDMELERLREAAAQALGLHELGRNDASSSRLDDSQDDDDEADETPMSIPKSEIKPLPSNGHSYFGATLSPSSLVSLPTTQSHLAPSLANSAPSARMSPDSLPPYPSSLAALSQFIQASSSMLTYYPSTFFAVALNRRSKQWKLRYIVFTSPPTSNKRAAFKTIRPHADFLTGNGTYDPLFGRHYHLHLFRNAAPSPDELEMDRLEINEDSGVYIIDREFGGKKGVLKVAGRDTRTSRSTTSEPVSDELGRTTWHLKLVDLQETQQWVGYIRSSVLQQRAERASLNYPHLVGNGLNQSLLNARSDMETLLSGQDSSAITSPRISHNSPKAISPTPTQSMFKSARSSSSSHTPVTQASAPNPRYAEHVGAAPSHLSPPSSVRARAYPSPLALNNASHAIRNLFRSPPPSSHDKENDLEETDKDVERKDIDPIPPEDSSFGQRATALLSVFRANGRPSNYPTSSIHASLIGRPISPPSYSDATLGKTMAQGEVQSIIGHHPASSIDWSMVREEVIKSAPIVDTSPVNGSLSPPPRSSRRPIGTLTANPQAPNEDPIKGKQRSSSPPTMRPPSAQSTSNSSYISAQDQPSRTVELERHQSLMTSSPGQKATPRSPSPIFEDRDGPSRTTNAALNPPSASVSSVSVSMWGTHHPYSKRVSMNSAVSINTVSTSHGSTKYAPPPKPPPKFAPPPAPLEGESATPNGKLRDSLISRPLRLSLNPPVAPPTHSLPPRPDEPGYRRSISSEARGSVLPTISAGSVTGSVSSFTVLPPTSSPPNRPLPPTPDSDSDRPSSPTKAIRRASLTRRLRIMSSPPPATALSASAAQQPYNKDAYLRPPVQIHERPRLPTSEAKIPHEHLPSMFLHMHDTPITPSIALGQSFLTVSPVPPPDDDEGETTSLPPPPRRSSRGSKETRKMRLSSDCKPSLPVSPSPAEPKDFGILELL